LHILARICLRQIRSRTWAVVLTILTNLNDCLKSQAVKYIESVNISQDDVRQFLEVTNR